MNDKWSKAMQKKKKIPVFLFVEMQFSRWAAILWQMVVTHRWSVMALAEHDSQKWQSSLCIGLPVSNSIHIILSIFDERLFVVNDSLVKTTKICDFLKIRPIIHKEIYLEGKSHTCTCIYNWWVCLSI